MDMFRRLGPLGNDALMSCLLERGKLLAACRFIRSQRLLNYPPRPLLAAACAHRDHASLFPAVFHFFRQRNEVWRGSPDFLPEEDCEEFVAVWERSYGDAAARGGLPPASLGGGLPPASWGGLLPPASFRPVGLMDEGMEEGIDAPASRRMPPGGMPPTAERADSAPVPGSGAEAAPSTPPLLRPLPTTPQPATPLPEVPLQQPSALVQAPTLAID